MTLAKSRTGRHGTDHERAFLFPGRSGSAGLAVRGEDEHAAVRGPLAAVVGEGPRFEMAETDPVAEEAVITHLHRQGELSGTAQSAEHLEESAAAVVIDSLGRAEHGEVKRTTATKSEEVGSAPVVRRRLQDREVLDSARGARHDQRQS